jgi:hypothetical protein
MIRRNFWKALWFFLAVTALTIGVSFARYNYSVPNSNAWVRYDLITDEAMICYIPQTIAQARYQVFLCEEGHFEGQVDALIRGNKILSDMKRRAEEGQVQ